ncbi:MAG: hypothetical protein JWO57_2512 [Pseudonocardiales bacterium]|nr:hypothetical protein [Pseudonocardiales bacterium]
MTESNRLRLLYHFTAPVNVSEILDSGQLRPNPVRSASRRRARDVVWLTDSADPGRGTDHGLVPSDPQAADLDKRLIRFTLSVSDAQHWPEWASRHRVRRTTQRELDMAGNGLSTRWWVVSRPVHSTEWVRVENLRTGHLVWPTGSPAESGNTPAGLWQY